MNILFLGDISGKTGREAVHHHLYNLKEKYADVIVSNGKGNITTTDHCSDLKKSDNFFVSANSGNLVFSGEMELVFCMP